MFGFSECPSNSKRKGKLLNTIGDFEILEILKEEEGEYLGVVVKIENVVIAERKGRG